MIKKKNIFENPKYHSEEEYFEDLINAQNFRLERIISEGHASPEDFWYNQSEDEFVLLLKGSAEILFEDGQTVELTEGDYFTIPKHYKHRVVKTSSDRKTFWLTLFH